MSRLQWAHTLTPSPTEPRDRIYDVYGDAFNVERTAAFAENDEDLVDLPDGRAYRSLSRAGLLLVAVGLPVRQILAPIIDADPFSVGIYCAIENGPNDYASAKSMRDASPAEFASSYKALRSPKYYFKMLANVPPSQLGIFLGVMGPLYTYKHSRLACRRNCLRRVHARRPAARHAEPAHGAGRGDAVGRRGMPCADTRWGLFRLVVPSLPVFFVFVWNRY
jgi:hypothetical protein